LSTADIFSDSYHGARDKFREPCHDAEIDVHSIVLPDHKGPDQVELAIDVAHVGVESSATQALIITGTHGIEGYCGSAILTNSLSSGEHRRIAQDLAVLLIHVLNPWGMAYQSRTNENNIDLNRFSLDFIAARPKNDQYMALHSDICPQRWDDKNRLLHTLLDPVIKEPQTYNSTLPAAWDTTQMIRLWY